MTDLHNFPPKIVSKIAAEAIKGDRSSADLAKTYGVDAGVIEEWHAEFATHIARTVLFGFQETDIYKKYVEVGNELEKMRWYANQHVVEDFPSRAMTNICLAAYDSGVTPIIRLEAALFALATTANPLATSTIVRSYMEFAGRVHKGARLWRNYGGGKLTPEEFCDATSKLIYEYVAKGEKKKRSIMFSGGYNVMTFIDALEDKIPGAREIYGDISTYTHGDYWNQHITAKIAHWHRDDPQENPAKMTHEKLLDGLRAVLFDDFAMMIEKTEKPRRKFDAAHAEPPAP